MIWFYFIPHKIKRGETFAWEDVWLLIPGRKRSLWLTIDAVGRPYSDEEIEKDATGYFKMCQEDRQAYLDRMGDKDYICQEQDKTNFCVRADVLTKPVLLKWVKVWIRDHIGDPNPKLKQGKKQDFEGTNSDATNIAKAKKIKKQIEKECGKKSKKQAQN